MLTRNVALYKRPPRMAWSQKDRIRVLMKRHIHVLFWVVTTLLLPMTIPLWSLRHAFCMQRLEIWLFRTLLYLHNNRDSRWNICWRFRKFALPRYFWLKYWLWQNSPHGPRGPLYRNSASLRISEEMAECCGRIAGDMRLWTFYLNRTSQYRTIEQISSSRDLKHSQQQPQTWHLPRVSAFLQILFRLIMIWLSELT